MSSLDHSSVEFLMDWSEGVDLFSVTAALTVEPAVSQITGLY